MRYADRMKTGMLYKEALGHVIREERIDRKLTLRQLSSRSHIALGYLSELERGHKDASSEITDSVACGLGITAGELVVRAGILLGGYRVPDTIEELLVDQV